MEVGLTARIKPSIDKRSLSREVDTLRGAVEDQFQSLDLGITELLDEDSGLMGRLTGGLGGGLQGDMGNSAMSDIRGMGQGGFTDMILDSVAEYTPDDPTRGESAPAAPAGGGDDDIFSELANEIIDGFSEEIGGLEELVDSDSALLGSLAGGIGKAGTLLGGLTGLLAGGAATVAVAGFAINILQGIWDGVRALSSTSPLLGQVVSMLDMAMMLMFRPFANLIGRMLLPMVAGLLQTMIKFNEVADGGDAIMEGVKFLTGKIVDAIFSIPGLIVAGFLAVGAAIGGVIGGAIATFLAGAIGSAISAKLGVSIGGALGSFLGPVGTVVGAVVGGLLFAGIGILVAIFRDKIGAKLSGIISWLDSLVSGFFKFLSQADVLLNLAAPALVPFALLFTALHKKLSSFLDSFGGEDGGIKGMIMDLFPEITVSDIIGDTVSLGASDIIDDRLSIVAKHLIAQKIKPIAKDVIKKINSWSINDVISKIQFGINDIVQKTTFRIDEIVQKIRGWDINSVIPEVTDWNITEITGSIDDLNPMDLINGEGSNGNSPDSTDDDDDDEFDFGGGGGSGGGGGGGGQGPPSAPVRIQQFASGGIVTGTTLGMIGEGKESEAVMPLSKLQSVIDMNNGSNASVDTRRSARSGTDEVENTIDNMSDDIVQELARLRRMIRNQDQEVTVKVGEREIIDAVHSAEENTRSNTRIDR